MRFAWVLGVLAAGCMGPLQVGESSSGIIGGTTDTADPGVVLLFAQQPGSTSGSLCTAEIISPHVVLTAAHCVSPAEVGAGAQFIVYTGPDFNNQVQADTLQVSETHPNPAWDANNLPGGHDVGVAILAQATTITPLPFNASPMAQTMVGQSVRFVGYGLDNATAQTGAGVKRQTTTMLSDYDNVKLHFADGTHETCNGDSGGPAFMMMGGVETIVGTTSYGDVNCAAGGYDTRVDAENAFITGYVKQFDPGTMTTPPSNPPTNPPATNPPSSGSPGSGSPPTSETPGGPSSPPSKHDGSAQLGDKCATDADCASHTCGIGTSGGMVCVSAGAGNNGTLGGCAMSGGADGSAMTLLALALLALAGFRRAWARAAAKAR
jgi:V8-like Glu-specific endopeptidase